METSLQLPFNQAQVEILKLFSQGLTDEQLKELQKVLIAFRFKMLDEHVVKVTKEKNISLGEINEVSKAQQIN